MGGPSATVSIGRSGYCACSPVAAVAACSESSAADYLGSGRSNAAFTQVAPLRTRLRRYRQSGTDER